ncbi:Transcriptional regulatory protein ZraR [compost metagenome]
MEALAKIEAKAYDLVITDIRMDRMDGMELMDAIKSRWPATPVIVMTAFASIDTAVRSIHEGACAYLSKPYELNDVRSTVRRALMGRIRL